MNRVFLKSDALTNLSIVLSIGTALSGIPFDIVQASQEQKPSPSSVEYYSDKYVIAEESLSNDTILISNDALDYLTLVSFAEKILDTTFELDPAIQTAIEDNFWEMI